MKKEKRTKYIDLVNMKCANFNGGVRNVIFKWESTHLEDRKRLKPKQLWVNKSRVKKHMSPPKDRSRLS